MSQVISAHSINAQLAMAAYAEGLSKDLIRDEFINTLRVDAKFSQIQAEDFVETYDVVDQQANTASGFSAVVFRNKETGKYTFSVRGTEMPDFGFDLDSARDWATNLGGIGGEGIAVDQMLDMYNYYLRLTAKAGQSVLQYSYDSQAQQITVNSFAAQEDGLLTGEAFDVTGHSLGGHLATILGRLAPSAVESVYTYNAPGFDPPATNPEPGSEFFFNELRDIEIAVQEDSDIAGAFDVFKNNHLVVPDDIVHRLGITGSVPGTQLEHFSEGDGLKSSHSISNITDALAVYDLLAHLDPAKPAESILTLGTDILEGASNRAEASLEAVVNGLGKLFGTGVDVAVGDRNQLYTGIHAIREALPDTASHQLVNLVRLGPDDLRARATADTNEGLAYRYALQNLLPFAVLGDPGLYDQEALAAEDFSQDYLADRAEALSILLQGNLRDRAAVRRDGRHVRIGTDFIDHDAEGSTHTIARIAGCGQGGARIRQVRFGSAEGDTLYGGSEADRLYGGPGVDDARVLKHGLCMSKLDCREAA